MKLQRTKIWQKIRRQNFALKSPKDKNSTWNSDDKNSDSMQGVAQKQSEAEKLNCKKPNSKKSDGNTFTDAKDDSD